ncbi:MAG: VOC family protein [Chloroflexota bacterium]
MIFGINHITFSVRDIEESFAFYTQLLGCELVAKWPTGAYVLAGDLWLALIQEDETRAAPLPEYSHIALAVTKASFPKLVERLKATGVESWQENWTEGDSFYFLDPNHHKLELHSTDLATRLESAKASPWDGLEIYK